MGLSIQELSSRISNLNRIRTESAMANSILVPKARGQIHKEQITELLKKESNDSIDEDEEQMLNTLSTACLAIGLDEEKICLPWK
jgi:hypothetical protein